MVNYQTNKDLENEEGRRNPPAKRVLPMHRFVGGFWYA